jgi:alkylhydroperoxidase/carboxymuconolactone decarboxylase family protein YurZ
MTRLPIETLDSAPASTIPRLGKGRAVAGKVLNLHGQMAHAPTVFGAYWAMRDAVEQHATLEPKVRAALMLTVSAVTGSAYSLAVNKMLAARAGWRPGEIAALAIAVPLDTDDRTAALVAVIRQAAADEGHVREQTWDAALEAGWTTDQLGESFALLAIVLFVDFFVNFAQTPLDVEHLAR